MKKRIYMFILILSITFSSIISPVYSAEPTGRVYGDIDNNGSIDASDALEALQYSVQKISFGISTLVYADVTADGKVTANDALCILQYSVKKIAEFASDGYSPKELYYGLLNKQYGADYSEFNDITDIDNYMDAKELNQKLGKAPSAADVDTWGVNGEGLLIYNQISRESHTDKYEKATKKSGSISIGNTVLNYSVPVNVTAYDAVPVEYSISSDKNTDYYVQATAYDDITRYADENADYFDTTLPGSPALSFKYDGYVAGTYYGKSSKPVQTYDTQGDVMAQTYPDYQFTDLTNSGDVKSSDLLWFKFTYKNTGDTILDSEGNAAFGYTFVLEKKNFKGAYETYYSSVNTNKVLPDYLYPGESGEVYYAVYSENSQPLKLPEGDYRIVVNGSMRMESTTSVWPWGYGNCNVSRSEFEFSVSDNGSNETPKEMRNESFPTSQRCTWIGSFEEFMGSYNKHLKVSADSSAPTKGKIYVQVAPWSNYIVLKLIIDGTNQIKTVKIPVNTESESIKVELNPYNENYYVKDDGTRTPLVQAMDMVDMRENINIAPDVSGTIINTVLNMKEAGINNIATTQTMTGDYTGLYDMTWFMMDVARKLKMNTEGSTLYYYRSTLPAIRINASGSNAAIGGQRDIYNMNGVDSAQGILARYNLIRYGDTYYSAADGTLPIALEDNWGWFGGFLNNRYACTGSYFNRTFRGWLKSAFGTIDKLNTAYNSGYASFDDINVEADGVVSDISGYAALSLDDSSKTYSDWTAATADLDLFRTAQRVNGYKIMLDELGVGGAKIALRNESNAFLASGISQTTKNSRYRYIYYDQRRSAMIPEVLSASDTIYSDSSYCSLALSNKEVYELTRQTEKSGFISAKLYSMQHMIDPVVSNNYGSSAKKQYNLKSDDKISYICSSKSLFTYFKAVYEAGGIPGLMWNDFVTDNFLTATQYKELKFFTEKINQMLKSEEGKKWASDFSKTEPDFKDMVKGVYSYVPQYVENTIKNTVRNNIFENSYN